MNIIYVLDASGSIAQHKKEYLSHLNDVIADQAEDVRFSLYFFNSKVHRKYYLEPIPSVAPLQLDDYRTAGMTALYDAIGAALDDHPKTSDVVTQLVIMTDGEENASQSWTKEIIQSRIKDRVDNCGWEALFVGANQDAWQTGKSLGCTRVHAYENSTSSLATASQAVKELLQTTYTNS